MLRSFLLKTVLFLLVLIGGAAVIFHLDDENMLKLGEDTVKSVRIEPEIERKKIIRADIPIIKIGDETVYYPEFEFYLLATKKDYETMLGKGVWSVTRNGRSMEELLKTDIIEEIAHLKIVVNEAKKEGYSLSEAEAQEIKNSAKEQLKGIDPILKAGYYLDEELITRIYEENFLASKFFNGYSQAANVEGEAAKKLFNTAYDIWENAYTAEIYWENIDGVTVERLESVRE
jgi:hypothetical protein